MDHYMEPQTIVDEDSQDAVVNANVAELESSQYDEPHTATKKTKEKPDIDWHSKTPCIVETKIYYR